MASPAGVILPADDSKREVHLHLQTASKRGTGSVIRAFPGARPRFVALRALTPYSYHIFLLGLIPIAFWLDVHTSSIDQQNVLGLMAYVILLAWTRLSPPAERRQVWIMVAVATCVEIWSSIIWGIYRYRFGNMPLFVPWGHGLVYLFALRAARTPLMERYGRPITHLAYLAATGWAVFGLTIEPLLMHRLDITGAMFWPIFAWFMRKPSAPIFAAAFFVTSYLELVGTHLGNWAWQTYAPISHVATGNPPSVISAGYCVMDFTAIKVAAMLPAVGICGRLVGRARARLQPVDSEAAA